MKRTVEVTYSNSAKINRGNYEQESPMYSLKSVLQCENGEVVDERAESLRLKSMVDPLLKDHIRVAKNDLSRFSIRDINGEKFVSVTSILQPDPLDLPAELLKNYADRGNEVERLCVEFIKTGTWQDPHGEIGKLTWADIKYQEWFEQYGMQFHWQDVQFQSEIINTRHHFYGKLDALTVLNAVPTILDFKTGRWSWSQLVAYANGDTIAPTFQVAIADLKKCKLEILDRTQDAWHDAWETFLVKRGEFKGRFGI